jgi:aldehyde:ferredoxin oxidoreductase
MGADHTAGLVIVSSGDPVKESQDLQLVNALCDSSGFCQFQQPSIDDVRTLYGAMLGREVTFEEAAEIGWQCMSDEWEFNRKAGKPPEEADVPEWCRTEKVPGNDAVFAVDRASLNKMFTRFPITDELRAKKAVG